MSTIVTLRAATRAMREGVACESDWSILAIAIRRALSMHAHGVGRGLAGHLQAAETALDEIQRRAMETGAWRATPLHYQEIEILATAVDLYELQLQQLGPRRRRRASAYSAFEIRSTGHRVRTSPQGTAA